MERALARHPTMRERVFTPEESAYCDSKARPAESYAGRFAAREADDQGARGLPGQALAGHQRQPRIRAAPPRSSWPGNAKRAPTRSGITQVLITFTHEKTNAVAFAVAVDHVKPVLTPQEAAELDRATQARGRPRGGPDGAGRTRRRPRGRRRHGRRLRAARRGRLRQGEQRRRRVRGGAAPCAVGHAGRRVSLDGPADLREPAAAQPQRLGRAEALGASRATAAALDRELARADVAVDAIFGTGFRGSPEDELGGGDRRPERRRRSRSSRSTSPSGVDGATGAVEGDAVWAELTVTFGAAKVGAVLLPGAERAGAVRVVDIGFPDDLVRSTRSSSSPATSPPSCPTRATDTHKRASGVLVVVAGLARHDRCAGPDRARRPAGSAPGSCSWPRRTASCRSCRPRDRGGVPAAARDRRGHRVGRGAATPCWRRSAAPTRSRSVPGSRATTETRRVRPRPRPRDARCRWCSTPTGSTRSRGARRRSPIGRPTPSSRPTDGEFAPARPGREHASSRAIASRAARRLASTRARWRCSRGAHAVAATRRAARGSTRPAPGPGHGRIGRRAHRHDRRGCSPEGSSPPTRRRPAPTCTGSRACFAAGHARRGNARRRRRRACAGGGARRCGGTS